MIQIPETLPVPKHHTMKVVDSSKIQSFQDCPRGFFFSYVLGLRPDTPNVHLDFGSAWHDAMEAMLLAEGYTQEAIDHAYHLFLETYREAFPDEITDNDRSPKNPEYAYKALKMYAKQYEKDNFRVIYTETAGLVPVSEKRELVVKLDSIIEDRNDGKINSMEHKTTGRNSYTWRDKWAMMLQVESYTHLLYSMYPEEKVGKVIINGSVFTKTKTWEGIRIPVYKSKKQMAGFLWNVNHWIDQIEWNYQQLSKETPDSPVMKAFPINCSSCSKFGCRMGGVCATFPNPLRFSEEGLAGYEIDFWDPLRRNVEKADNIIQKTEDGKLEIVKKPEEPEGEEDQALDEFHNAGNQGMLRVVKEEKPKEEDFSMFTKKDE